MPKSLSEEKDDVGYFWRAATKRARSGRQAVQVFPHPVRRLTSSSVVRSVSIRAAISWKESPAHSQRVMARGVGVRYASHSATWVSIDTGMILKVKSDFKFDLAAG
jgi:hypothetical protein